MGFAHVCQFAGGLALFLYGMELTSTGMRRSSGAGTRTVLMRLTRFRLPGLLAGILLSFAMQSSGAATVMLVGLAETGLVDLARALPVALGTAIGTTLTVQIIAFKIGDWSLLICVVALLVRWLCRYDRHKRIGDALFGLGLIFFGMTLMGESAKPLAQVPWFGRLLTGVADSPALGVLVSAVLTGIVLSSAAMIAVVMSVVASRAGTDFTALEALRISVPLILGANIGTCVTALIASSTSSRLGKRVALGNLLFKVGGVLLCLPICGVFADGVWRLTTLVVDPAHTPAAIVATRAIANAHTVFNVVAALVFLPFIGLFRALIERILPDKSPQPVSRALAERLLSMPEVAVEAIAAEVRTTAVHVRNMYTLARKAVLEKDRAAVDQVRHDDDKVDRALVEVTDYAIALSAEDLSEHVAARRDAMLVALRDLEQIGDILSKLIVELARKTIEMGQEYSAEGHEELTGVFQEVADSFDNALRVLSLCDRDAAKKVRSYDKKFAKNRRRLFDRHLERLSTGNPKTAATLAVHMDVVTALGQVHGLLTDIVSVVVHSPPVQGE